MTDAIKQRRFVGQPFDEYAAMDGINATAIKAGQKSMLHMHHVMTQSSREESPVMRMGRHIHGMVLEPESYAQKLCLWNGKKRYGKEWDEWCGNNDAHYAIRPHELSDLTRISAAIHVNRRAHELITSTQHEISFQWQGKYGTGKARLDGHDEKQGIVEYKTAGNIEPRAFMNNAYRMGYHLQLGWYAMAVREVRGKVPMVNVIVQEQSEPWDCYVLEVPHTVIIKAMEDAAEIARQYHICRAINQFPGIARGEAMQWDPPAWATSDEPWTVE